MTSQAANSNDGPSYPQVHRSLTADLKEFRLVSIHPSTDFSSVLECHLIQTTFGVCPAYEALSYVWGKPDFTQRILLDNEPFYVTPNLEVALKYLRRHDTDRILWVDAICINQKDTDERNEQVGHMAEIYSHCTVDLFWLGPENDDVKGGMEIVRKLDNIDITKLQALNWKKGTYRRKKEEELRPYWRVPLEDWQKLKALFVEPEIWRRVWVIQEISFAPKASLISGNDVLDWEVVEAALATDEYYDDAFHVPFSHYTHKLTSTTFSNPKIIKNQRKAVRKLQQGGSSSLLDVLARFRFTNSTDPRDKVFALLGLISDTLGVKVDYHNSTRNVFMNVVECLINSSQNLDILCQSQWAIFKNPERKPDLPSWVPDFNAPGKASFLFAQREIFSAGDPVCGTPCQISEDGKLALIGVSLGRVAEVPGRDYPSISAEKRESTKTVDVLLTWLPNHVVDMETVTLNPTQAYYTGEPLFQAFWRTLAVDCKAYPMMRLTSEEISNDMKIFRQIVDAAKYSGTLDGTDSRIISNLFDQLISQRILKDISQKWRFAVSDSGLYAMVPLETQEGDQLAVLHGAKVPFVLRQRYESNEDASNLMFNIVGGAYIHGFMNGEARAGVERNNHTEQTFLLI